MTTTDEMKTERGGFFRRLFGPSKAELRNDIEMMSHRLTASRICKTRAEEKLSTLNAQLSTLKAARNVSWTKPAVRMPAALVLAEFNVPLDQGIGMALHQELDDRLQELLDLVSQPPHGAYTQKDGSTVPAFTEADRLHLAGGIEHLRLFQKQLLDLSARASTEDADLGEEDK